MKNKKLNKKFKALIIDCDGTLIENKANAMPSVKVMDAIKKASAYLHIGIATQRPLFYARPILKHLKLSGPSIISGGAQVIDSESLKMLHEEPIKGIDLIKIVKVVNYFRRKADLRFYIQNEDGADQEFTDGPIPQKAVEAALFSLEEEIADQLKDKLSEISTLAVHKVTSWELGRFGVVINHAQATKQHGIFVVAKILNIDTHEIIGVGDSYNDYPLLLACGLKVAMGNAVSELKEIADYIAPTVEKDGVADVVNKFIL